MGGYQSGMGFVTFDEEPQMSQKHKKHKQHNTVKFLCVFQQKQTDSNDNNTTQTQDRNKASCMYNTKHKTHTPFRGCVCVCLCVYKMMWPN